MPRPDLPPIIALCGPAGVGKSTLARVLADLAPRFAISGKGDRRAVRLPSCGVVVSLAAPLKTMLRTLGVPAENLNGTLDQKEAPLDLLCGKSARAAMRTLGTEWGRECIHPELWLRAWEHAAHQAVAKQTAPSLVIVDDLRFDNERLYLQRLGAVVVRLFRAGCYYEGDHASERGPATYDCGFELEDQPHPAMLGDALDPEGAWGRNAYGVLQAAIDADSRRPTNDPSPMQRLLRILEIHACT